MPRSKKTAGATKKAAARNTTKKAAPAPSPSDGAGAATPPKAPEAIAKVLGSLAGSTTQPASDPKADREKRSELIARKASIVQQLQAEHDPKTRDELLDELGRIEDDMPAVSTYEPHGDGFAPVEDPDGEHEPGPELAPVDDPDGEAARYAAALEAAKPAPVDVPEDLPGPGGADVPLDVNPPETIPAVTSGGNFA